MTRIVCRSSISSLPKRTADILPVVVYAANGRNFGVGSIGNQLIEAIKRLGVVVSQRAFDFLTVALAVTAADTFIKRETAADGWSRKFDMDIAVAEPKVWELVKDDFEEALRFLSGDMWTFDFHHSGFDVPMPYIHNSGRRKITSLGDRDCACLFSGGLDSAVGVLDLLSQNRRPILISHSYRGDKSRQEAIAQGLPIKTSHFSAAANPVSPESNDTTMRTRSLSFLAYGSVVVSALSSIMNNEIVDLFVPENGFISLNVPLTPRRIGALSTRTTHPYFLSLIQKVFDSLGIPAKIINPYRFKTKGEMLKECADQVSLLSIAKNSVSCGKWKRTGIQCGRCIPCLIRRSSFTAAGFHDSTIYRFKDLSTVIADKSERDDLLALMSAISRAKTQSIKYWITTSGPLPENRAERNDYMEVFKRGLGEVEVYLTSLGFTV